MSLPEPAAADWIDHRDALQAWLDNVPADAAVGLDALAVERAGGRDWAQAQAADRMARAVQALATAVPDPEEAGGLLALAEFVTRRSA